jgi:hypothetical protein
MINDKEYIGFHTIKSLDDILFNNSENGSIFYDGYLGSGKLMKMALQKYGPMNMRQELILITEDKKEAEDLEKEIVCREWIISDKNYNLSVGGNVTILFGEQNGFYGKTHSKETIEKIQRKRKEAYDEAPFSWCESFLVEDESVTFLNSNQIIEYFGIEKDDWFEVNKLIYEGVIRYKSVYLQKAAIQRYLKRYSFLNDHEARTAAKERLSKLCSERFSGVPKTKESNEKRGLSIKTWIDNNPEKHQERMLKINKNPEKIQKTAEKHRGMKRSDESKRKMSEAKKGKLANNKGKIFIHNTKTRERTYIDKDMQIPEGWVRGMGKVK